MNYFNTEAGKLINPPLQSKFFEKYKDFLEKVYSSHRNAPLGCAPTTNIPISNTERIFGVSTARGIPAIDLMYPFERKMPHSVYSDDFNYEKCNDSVESAGVKSKNLGNSGEQIKELFNYKKYSTTILPSSSAKRIYSSHRENGTSGIIEEKDFFMKENRAPSKLEKSIKDFVDKQLLEVVWTLLKIKNHEEFPDLVSAFKAYKNKNDKITLLDLQKMCQKFGISTPVHVLERLLEKCDIINKDGVLSYEEFLHSLNWKDLLPENRNFKNIKYASDWKEGINNPSETVRDSYRTTASFVGDHKYTVSSQTAGLPSQRKNIDRSRLKGISEFNEFGNAASAIQPNAFIKYGIFDEDLNELLPKHEIKSRLMRSGIRFSDTAFESAWKNVSNNGKASIGKIWSTLKKNCLLHTQY